MRPRLDLPSVVQDHTKQLRGRKRDDETRTTHCLQSHLLSPRQVQVVPPSDCVFPTLHVLVPLRQPTTCRTATRLKTPRQMFRERHNFWLLQLPAAGSGCRSRGVTGVFFLCFGNPGTRATIFGTVGDTRNGHFAQHRPRNKGNWIFAGSGDPRNQEAGHGRAEDATTHTNRNCDSYDKAFGS